MAVRYSKRQLDGTVRYYDSEAEMKADSPDMPGLFDFSWFWAIIGFGLSAIVGVIAIGHVGFADEWPKAVRFIAILGFASAAGYVVGRIGQALFMTFWALVGIGILAGLGALIWRFT